MLPTSITFAAARLSGNHFTSVPSDNKPKDSIENAVTKFTPSGALSRADWIQKFVSNLI